MTIYTVVGSDGSLEWASKSFYELKLAEEFISHCIYIVRKAPNLKCLLEATPDTVLKNRSQINIIKIEHITYSLNENELVIDDFMKQVMVPDLC